MENETLNVSSVDQTTTVGTEQIQFGTFPPVNVVIPPPISAMSKLRLLDRYIQCRLADALFKVYSNVETSKELWDSLDKKYRTEDAGSQKYAVAKFLNYKMVDSRPIMDQVGKVACIIEKLPPHWTVFKNYLKLKKKWMSLEELTMKLHMESTNRKNLGTGHKSFECRSKKAPKKHEANLAYPDMCAMITEANVAKSHPKAWWFDTGATRHICLDRSMFSAYTKNKSYEKLFMGNSVTSKIEGYGKVVLKLTSVRELTLTHVVHVSDMRKNLISGSLMSKHGFTNKLEADKLVLSKNGMYMGKRYTKSYGLHYGKEAAVLEGYSDANCVSDSKNSKSTSAYVFKLGGAAVSWKSSKQTLLARSTMESEFIVRDKAAEEAERLQNFLEDIPL
ncbi:uncharacterized protein LOC112085292 [Eutrema salsugineum]|uniref:uncharacterized protein LOC112085292 n=1 Tax=Eutrema salsugineum TaxID=72664 RepID=UPI000CED502A|nr:uncharacterized protein LOC112085292 [Eutrema salsugineum]